MLNLNKLNRLAADVRKARRYGITTVVFRPRTATTDPIDDLDALAAGLGFHGLGEDWVEIPFATANDLAAKVLHRHLAYDAEMMPRDKAVEFAARFLHAFGELGRYFSNCEAFPPGGDRSWCWWPLTESTLDRGVAGVGTEWVGLLWVQDED